MANNPTNPPPVPGYTYLPGATIRQSQYKYDPQKTADLWRWKNVGNQWQAEVNQPAPRQNFQLDYTPSYWEDPRIVAQTYNWRQAQRGLNQPPPAWVDDQQLESVYQYYKFANKDKPWWEWQYLHPEDPARSWLQTLPTPPEFQPPLVDETIRQQQQIAQQEIDWSQVPGWQRTTAEAMSNPYVMGIGQAVPWAVIGAGGALAAGAALPAAAVAGGGALLLGGFLGLATDPKVYDTLRQWGADPALEEWLYERAKQTTNLLNKPAEWFEQGIGLSGQVLGSILDPKTYGALGEITRSQAAWRAARSAYNASPTFGMLGNIPAILGGDTDQLAGPGQAWKLPEQDPVTGEWKYYPNPVATGETDSTKVLVQARRSIQQLIDSGVSPWAAGRMVEQSVRQQYGISGEFSEMALQSALDPFNWSEGAERAAIRHTIGAKAPKLAELTQSMKTAGGVEVLKTYGAMLRTGEAGLTAEEIGRTWWTRVLAGTDRSGRLKLLDQSSRFPFLSQTPESRAWELLGVTHDNAAILTSQTNNVEEMHGMLERWGNTPTEAAREYSNAALGSPEGAAAALAIREYATSPDSPRRTLLNIWQQTGEQREMLTKISTALKLGTGEVVARLKSAESAEALTLRLVEEARSSDDPAAKQLAADYDAKVWSGADLQKMLDVYVTGDAAFSPEMHRAQLMAGLIEAGEKFSVKYFNLKPQSAIFRLADTLKAAQSLVFLGLNPRYLVNNVINGEVVMGYEGVLKFYAPGEIEKFWSRFGVDPFRLHSGYGFGKDTDASSAAGEAIRKATTRNDALQRAGDKVRAVGNKLGIFATWAQEVERLQSARAYTAGTQAFWGRIWRRGNGFDKLPPALESRLAAINPRLPDMIYGLVEGGINPADLVERLFKGVMRQDVNIYLDDVAEEIGVDAARLRESLSQMGITTWLNDALAEADTPNKVNEVFVEMDRRVQQTLEAQGVDEIRERAEQAAQAVQAAVAEETAPQQQAADEAERRSMEAAEQAEQAEQRAREAQRTADEAEQAAQTVQDVIGPVTDDAVNLPEPAEQTEREAWRQENERMLQEAERARQEAEQAHLDRSNAKQAEREARRQEAEQARQEAERAIQDAEAAEQDRLKAEADLKAAKQQAMARSFLEALELFDEVDLNTLAAWNQQFIESGNTALEAHAKLSKRQRNLLWRLQQEQDGERWRRLRDQEHATTAGIIRGFKDAGIETPPAVLDNLTAAGKVWNQFYEERNQLLRRWFESDIKTRKWSDVQKQIEEAYSEAYLDASTLRQGMDKALVEMARSAGGDELAEKYDAYRRQISALRGGMALSMANFRGTLEGLTANQRLAAWHAFVNTTLGPMMRQFFAEKIGRRHAISMLPEPIIPDWRQTPPPPGVVEAFEKLLADYEIEGFTGLVRVLHNVNKHMGDQPITLDEIRHSPTVSRIAALGRALDAWKAERDAEQAAKDEMRRVAEQAKDEALRKADEERREAPPEAQREPQESPEAQREPQEPGKATQEPVKETPVDKTKLGDERDDKIQATAKTAYQRLFDRAAVQAAIDQGQPADRARLFKDVIEQMRIDAQLIAGKRVPLPFIPDHRPVKDRVLRTGDVATNVRVQDARWVKRIEYVRSNFGPGLMNIYLRLTAEDGKQVYVQVHDYAVERSYHLADMLSIQKIDGIEKVVVWRGESPKSVIFANTVDKSQEVHAEDVPYTYPGNGARTGAMVTFEGEDGVTTGRVVNEIHYEVMGEYHTLLEVLTSPGKVESVDISKITILDHGEYWGTRAEPAEIASWREWWTSGSEIGRRVAVDYQGTLVEGFVTETWLAYPTLALAVTIRDDAGNTMQAWADATRPVEITPEAPEVQAAVDDVRAMADAEAPAKPDGVRRVSEIAGQHLHRTAETMRAAKLLDNLVLSRRAAVDGFWVTVQNEPWVPLTIKTNGNQIIFESDVARLVFEFLPNALGMGELRLIAMRFMGKDGPITTEAQRVDAKIVAKTFVDEYRNGIVIDEAARKVLTSWQADTDIRARLEATAKEIVGPLQAPVWMAMLDAMAQTWGAVTGESPDLWYGRYIAGLVHTDRSLLPSDALRQVAQSNELKAAKQQLKELIARRVEVNKELKVKERRFLDIAWGYEKVSQSEKDAIVDEHLKLRSDAFNARTAIRDLQEKIKELEARSLWISPLGRALSGLKQSKMTVEQLRAELRKGGVKADELRYSGFGDWLDAQQPGQILTRDQIMQAPRSIEINEIVRSGEYTDRRYKESYSEKGGSKYTELLMMYAGAEEYKGPHWRENNVLAHIRFDTREDMRGRKVLFIEEIQSDWHQIGRQIGYGGAPESGDERFKQLKTEAYIASEEAMQALEARGRAVEAMLGAPYPAGMEIYREADRIYELAMERRENAWTDLGNYRDRPPEAPWKNTEAWTGLALRRAIRYAAAKGYTRIAWTTGEQQTNRYTRTDITLTWKKVLNESVQVTETDLSGNENTKNYVLRKIPSLYGADVARQMEEGESGVITDFRVGQAAFAKMYDEIIPRLADAYGKRFGVRSAMDNVDRFVGTVHVMELTPAMKADAMDGMALFQRAKIDYRARINAAGGLDTETVRAIVEQGGRQGIDELIRFIQHQRQRFNRGQMGVRDVAKAYIITTSSFGLKHTNFELVARLFEKAGASLNNLVDRRGEPVSVADYVMLDGKGRQVIRPESMAALWLMTAPGRAALDAMERGEYDSQAWETFRTIRIGMGGRNTFSQLGVLEDKPNGKSAYNMRNLSEFVKVLNNTGGDPDAVMQAMEQLSGVSVGKSAFVGWMLGFGEYITLDGQEWSAWLRGDDALIKYYRDNPAMGRALRDDMMAALRQISQDTGVMVDVPPEAYGASMHDIVWGHITRSYTTHPEIMQTMLHAQDVKGATQFLRDQRAMIMAFKSGDISTLVHETAHIYRRVMYDALQFVGEPDSFKAVQLRQDIAELERWAGAQNGAWTIAAEEKVARGFERYVAEGKAPTPGLQRMFDNLKRWLMDIYKAIIGSDIDVEINDNIRAIFGRWLDAEGWRSAPAVSDAPTAPAPDAERGSGAAFMTGDFGTVRNRTGPRGDGIEISFFQKPEPDVIRRMKANGFKWNPKGKVWYATETDNSRWTAEEVAGIRRDPDPEPEPGTQDNGYRLKTIIENMDVEEHARQRLKIYMMMDAGITNLADLFELVGSDDLSDSDRKEYIYGMIKQYEKELSSGRGDAFERLKFSQQRFTVWDFNAARDVGYAFIERLTHGLDTPDLADKLFIVLQRLDAVKSIRDHELIALAGGLIDDYTRDRANPWRERGEMIKAARIPLSTQPADTIDPKHPLTSMPGSEPAIDNEEPLPGEPENIAEPEAAVPAAEPQPTRAPGQQARMVDYLYGLIQREGLDGATLATNKALETALVGEFGLDLGEMGQVNAAYDALEGAFSLYLRDRRREIEQYPLFEQLERLDKIESKLTTARRNLEKMDLQQFSTPLTISHAAAFVADVRSGDVALEPTAGTGNLIEPLDSKEGIAVLVNEIDPERREILRALGYEPTGVDAISGEWLRYLGSEINEPVATVMLTNPPWGSYSTGKYGRPVNTPVVMNDWSQRFFYLTMTKVADGGRAVIVAPTNWAFSRNRAGGEVKPTGKPFMDWLKRTWTVRAIIEAPEGSYKHRGTGVDSLIIVVDKIKPNGDDFDAVMAYGDDRPADWRAYAAVLRRVVERSDERVAMAQERIHANEFRDVAKPRGEVLAGEPAMGQEPGMGDVGAPERVPDSGSMAELPNELGAGGKGVPGREQTGPGRSAESGMEAPGIGRGRPGGDLPDAPAERERAPVSDTELVADRPAAKRGRRGIKRSSEAGLVPLPGTLGNSTRTEQARETAIDEINNVDGYSVSTYTPSERISPHPRPLVEPSNLAGIRPPDVSSIELSADVFDASTRGIFSDDQREAVARIAYAVENGHAIVVSDGTGVGKGREIIGSAMDWFGSGRAKRILITTKNDINVLDLIQEAFDMSGARINPDGSMTPGDRFFSPTTGQEYHIVIVRDFKGELPEIDNAIYLATYSTLRTKLQLIMHAGIDGWLADEAHVAKNVPGRITEGNKDASEIGEAWTVLHSSLMGRNSPIAYFTATQAENVNDLYYLFGLREWNNQPGSFGVWLRYVTGDMDQSEYHNEISRMKLSGEQSRLAGEYFLRAKPEAEHQYPTSWSQPRVARPLGKYAIERLEVAGRGGTTGVEFSVRRIVLREGRQELGGLIASFRDELEAIGFAQYLVERGPDISMATPDSEVGNALDRMAVDFSQMGSKALMDSGALSSEQIESASRVTPRAGRGSVVFTPAHTEQLIRELKARGKFMSRELWSGGREYEMVEAPKGSAFFAGGKYDEFVDLFNDISHAYRRYGHMTNMDRSKKGGFGPNGMIQNFIRQLIGNVILRDALDRADDEIKQGHKPVISLTYKSELKADGGNLAAAINTIATREAVVDAEGNVVYDPSTGEVAFGATLPEAVMEVEELRGRAASLMADLFDMLFQDYPDAKRFRRSNSLPSPLQQIIDRFGRNQVSLVAGDSEDLIVEGRKIKLDASAEGKKFLRGETNLAVITPKGDTGISLHDKYDNGRRVLIFVDYDWDATHMLQRMGRVDRADQKTSPFIVLLHLAQALHKKGLVTVSSRMQDTGAISRGGSHATGISRFTDSLDLNSEFMRFSLTQAWYLDFSDRLREAFPYRENGMVPTVFPSKVTTKDFLLKLQQSLHVADAEHAYELWMNRAAALRDTPQYADHMARLTRKSTGKIIRRVNFQRADGLEMGLVECQNTAGQRFGVFTGILLDQMRRIRQVIGEDEGAKFIAFTDTASGEAVSGVLVPPSKLERMAHAFGSQLVSGVIPETALDVIRAGHKVRVQGANGQFILRERRDGLIEVEDVKREDVDTVRRAGAKFHARQFWFIGPNEVENFTREFRIIQDDAGAETLYQSERRGDADNRDYYKDMGSGLTAVSGFKAFSHGDWTITTAVFRDGVKVALIPAGVDAIGQAFSTATGPAKIIGVDPQNPNLWVVMLDGTLRHVPIVMTGKRAKKKVKPAAGATQPPAPPEPGVPAAPVQPQAGATPPQAVPGLPAAPVGANAGYKFLGAAQDEMYNETLRPAMQALRRKMTGNMAPKLRMADLDPASARDVKSWLRKVNGQMSTAKLASVRVGEMKRDAALLNYSKRYGWDNVLGAIFPYEFFYTRSMMNWALRILQSPKHLAMLARLREMGRRFEQEGFPERLADRVKIPMPWLPEWMGGGVWVDPLKQLFPFEMFGRPVEEMQRQDARRALEAERLIQRWSTEGSVPSNEASQALQTRSGAIWQRAMDQVKASSQADQMNPYEFSSLIMSPSLPLQMAYLGATGQMNKLSPLPITNMVQAGTAAMGMNQGRGYNLEGPVRRLLGLPEWGEYTEYWIDRQLANMAADGSADPKAVADAMAMQAGPIYEQAQARAAQERAVNQGGALLGLPALIYPEGERKLRELNDDFKAAMDAYRAGDDDAAEAFFETYPEYETRLMLYDDPQTRLKSILIGDIWDGYLALGSAHKGQVRDALGENFTEAFLDKTTRSYDAIGVETLANWAQALGSMTGEKVTEQAILKAEMTEDERAAVAFAPAWVARAVDEFTQERKQAFPNWYALQDRYYSQAPGKERQQFIHRFPELRSYWEWRRSKLDTNPDLKQWYDQANPNQATAVDWQALGPVLTLALASYYDGDKRLGAGAQTELRRQWEMAGKPAGNLNTWIEQTLREAYAGQ